MSSRTIGPEEIAKLHEEIVRSLARLVVAAFMPCVVGIYVVGLLLATLHQPTVAPSRVAAEITVGLLRTLPLHMALAGVAGALLIGISSLISWRHVLARGGPAALVPLLRAAWVRCLGCVGTLVLFGDRSEPPQRDSEPMSPMVEQLRDSLVVAPAAPPRPTPDPIERFPFSGRPTA